MSLDRRYSAQLQSAPGDPDYEAHTALDLFRLGKYLKEREAAGRIAAPEVEIILAQAASLQSRLVALAIPPESDQPPPHGEKGTVR